MEAAYVKRKKLEDEREAEEQKRIDAHDDLETPYVCESELSVQLCIRSDRINSFLIGDGGGDGGSETPLKELSFVYGELNSILFVSIRVQSCNEVSFTNVFRTSE